MEASVENSLQSPQDAQLKIIDPEGDITLTIPDKRTDAEKQRSGTSGGPRQFLVSSKLLKLASPYFKARLSGNWPEGKDLIENGSTELSVDCPGCDPQALSIILHIFHALGQQIPKRVSNGTLLNVALATDYLQCHAAVEVYGQRWVKALEKSLPKTSVEKAKDWIMISYTFRCQEIFQAMTMLAQRYGEKTFDTGGLPIPKFVKDGIDQKRTKFLGKLFKLINKHERRFHKGEKICNFPCDALHIGQLMKMLSRYRGGKHPHSGYSPNSLALDTKSWERLSQHIRGKKPYFLTASLTYCRHKRNILGREAHAHLRTMETYLGGLRLPQNSPQARP